MQKVSNFIENVNTIFSRLLVTLAKEQMSKTSAGRKHPNLPNVSSRWGDPPNIQSGAYLKSIRAERKGNGFVFGAGYKNSVGYVKILETKLNRPNIKKAHERAIQALPSIIEEELMKIDFSPRMYGFKRVKK